MAIDASIYQNLKPVQTPDVADTMQKAMTLRQLAYQNQQQDYSLQKQQALRDAYAKNMNPDGTLNEKGAISDYSQIDPMGGIALGKSLNEMAEQRAKTTSAQADSIPKQMAAVAPVILNLASMPEDQRAKAFDPSMKQLEAMGYPPPNVPKDANGNYLYDGQHFALASGQLFNSKPYQDYLLTKAEINKNNMDPMKTGAEELGKFKDDIVNASSRKTTGALIDTRTRADRILTLLNAGAKPGETPDQRVARLNQFMPQIGTEVGTSLAAIMQGGVPNEELMKKLDPDTVGAKIANLQQKYKAEPTAANQGALLNAYGEIAQKLRGFSADQLQQITGRVRQAYPYASKYYSDRMDKIAEPLLGPSSPQADPSGGIADEKGGGGSMIGGNKAEAKTNNDKQYRPKGATVSGVQVGQYAIKHNMQYSEAENYLKGHGYVIGN